MSAARARGRSQRSWLRIALWVVGVLVVIFAVIQLIPYGRNHDNPPVTTAFTWADPAAEAIARESCYDCHSNETKWWWATNIAPASWLVWRDVSEGRDHLNFSEWDGAVTTEQIQDAVDGEMPPLQYTLIHPGAKLSDEEKRTLVDGFAASLTGGQAGSSGSSASPSPTPTDTGDAAAIIQQRCSGCHSADRALSFHAGDAAEAQALIDSMKQRGAELTGPEEQALVDYFTR